MFATIAVAAPDERTFRQIVAALEDEVSYSSTNRAALCPTAIYLWVRETDDLRGREFNDYILSGEVSAEFLKLLYSRTRRSPSLPSMRINCAGKDL